MKTTFLRYSSMAFRSNRMVLIFGCIFCLFFFSACEDDDEVPASPVQGAQFVTINGTKVYAEVRGTQGPSVVLISGLGNPAESWDLVVDQLAGKAITVNYDRAGVGQSDTPTQRRDGQAVVAELHQLLKALRIPEPYIVVGHSVGGLYARLFAATFPTQTRGVVLLDATNDQQLLALEEFLKTQLPEGATMEAMLESMATEMGLERGAKQEFMEQFATARQVSESSFPQQAPLYIVTDTSPEAPPQNADAQAAWKALSSKSWQRLVGSGHNVPQNEPQISAQAILTVSQ